MEKFFFFSSRRRHTRCYRDWSSDMCSSDLQPRSQAAIVRERILTPCVGFPLAIRLTRGCLPVSSMICSFVLQIHRRPLLCREYPAFFRPGRLRHEKEDSACATTLCSRLFWAASRGHF